jgi:hypothetical protein
VPDSPFVVLVADSDNVVGVVAARLLASALDTEHTSFTTQVRVLLSQQEIDQLDEPLLPQSVKAMTQVAIAAQPSEIDHTKLIVGFAGLDQQKVDVLRSAGISAPAVNLCQFVLSLDAVNQSEESPPPDVRDVIVGAALQFGFGGGSARCQICADTVGDSIHYWINIADTCTRFAHTVQRLQR